MKKTAFLIASVGTVLSLATQPLQPVVASILSPIVGGTVFSSGQNFEGQIGMGDEMLLKSPMQIQLPVGLTAVSVARNVANTWVLASDGNVYGAGYNQSGELGDGTTTVRSAPVKLQLPAGLTVTSVKAHSTGYPDEGAVHVIASDGNVYSVGHNAYGEFGDGTTPDPLRANTTATKYDLPVGVTAVEIETTAFNTYVRGSDGQVYAAGYNLYGQLGDGTTSDKTTPVPMILPGGVTAQDIIVPGSISEFSVAIKGSNGQVYSAGQNYGTFGNGTTNATESTPVRFQLPGILTAGAVTVGNGITSVVASDGNLYSAGYNYDGRLGDGSTTLRSTPVQYILPGGVTAVTSTRVLYGNSQHVLGSDGQLYSSGYNDFGRFGVGTPLADDNVTTPTRFGLPVGVNVVKYAATWSGIQVVGSDGNVYSAGFNEFGEFGDGSTTQRNDPVEMNLPAGVNAADIFQNQNVPGTTHVLATNGIVYATGDTELGRSGTGSYSGNLLTPQPVTLPVLANVTNVHGATWLHSSMIVSASNNQLYSFGYNKYGQAATGSAMGWVFNPEEFILPGSVKAVEVQQNNGSLYVLGSDKQVYASGDNFYGQLGDSTRTDRFTPVKYLLPAGVDAVKIFFPSAASVSVLASDGNLYSAGDNQYGNLGIGAVNNYVSTPARYVLPAGVTVKRISETYGGTSGGGLARNMSVIGSNDVAYTAGANGYAQIGNGQSAFFPNVNTPQAFILPVGLTAAKVHNMDSITAVEASDGNVYLAGVNFYGQLGNGTNTDTSNVVGKLPTRFQLPAGVTVDRFDGTPQTSHVIGSNGQLYGAGENTNGELGDTTLTSRNVPVRFQLPAGLTVRSGDDLVIFDSGFGSIISVVASDNLAYSSGFGPAGSGAPNNFQSTPLQLPMPSGLTVSRLVTSYNPSGRMSVIASDNQLYQAGTNTYGQLGDGTTTTATSLVRFQLPAGVMAVNALPEANATIVLGSNGKVYVAGANASGWLASGSNNSVTTVTEYALPIGSEAIQIAAILGNKVSALATPFVYGIGSHTYCDANQNSSQDPGESMINGQTVNLYQSVGGSVSGSAIATYTTASYQAYDGTFFFDNLVAGEYIIGLEHESGELLSQPFTLAGTGDGWILGNSAFIDTVSAMGQTGFVCGTSTTVTPGPTTPTTPTPTTLAPTGASLVAVLSVALSVVMGSIVLVRRTVRHARRSVAFGS